MRCEPHRSRSPSTRRHRLTPRRAPSATGAAAIALAEVAREPADGAQISVLWRGAMVHGTTRHDDVTAAVTMGWPDRRVSPESRALPPRHRPPARRLGCLDHGGSRPDHVTHAVTQPLRTSSDVQRRCRTMTWRSKHRFVRWSDGRRRCVSDYGSEGWGFESLRARHIIPGQSRSVRAGFLAVGRACDPTGP